MSKKKVRIATKQPGVYLNQQTGKYEVKYNYTEYDPIENTKKYKTKWVYSIDSYKTALSTLANLKSGNLKVREDDFTLSDALELWMTKAEANVFSKSSVRNTNQQFRMITKFWSPDVKISYITEDNYMELISKCRKYGYSEETIHNINACLRKLVGLAYKNRKIQTNPFNYCDNARIRIDTVKKVVTYKE